MEGSSDDILQHMLQSNYREHNMLVYPHLDILRSIILGIPKGQLESGKERLSYIYLPMKIFPQSDVHLLTVDLM